MAGINKFILILLFFLIIVFAKVLFTTSKIAANAGDVYLHYYPLKYLVSEHLISGKMPLWNPYIFAGQPLLANPQSAVFYPLSLLFYFLPLPFAFNFFYFIHFFLAGLFSYLMFKYLNISNSGAVAGSFCYTFSSFLVYKIPAGHPVELSGYIWLPVIILFLEKQKEIIFQNIKWIYILALVFCFQFLSGHTFPVYISGVFIIAHLLYNRLSYWKSISYTVCLSFFISAVQLIPTIELSSFVETSNWYGLAANYSFQLKNFINLFLPNFFGNIIDKNFIYQQNPSYFFERHCVYIGIIPVFLALAGFFRQLKEGKYFYPGIMILGIFLSAGLYNPVYKFFYMFLPALDYLRVPSRFYYLCVIAMSMLAAYSWQYLIGNKKKPVLNFMFFLLIVIDLFAWNNKFIAAESMDSYRKKSEISEYVNPLYRLATEPMTISSNKSMMYHHYNLNGYEAIILSDFVRYIGFQETKFMTPTGLSRLNFASPLSKGLSVGYIVTFNTMPGTAIIKTLSNGINIYCVPNALPRVFIAKNVKVMENANFMQKEKYLQKTSHTPDEEILVPWAPKDFPLLSLGGKIVSYNCSSDKITAEVQLPAANTLVFSEIFYNGWRAWCAGKQENIIRGNRALKVLFLQKGEYIKNNKIILYYLPGSFLLGLYISLASIAAMIILLRFINFTNDAQ